MFEEGVSERTNPRWRQPTLVLMSLLAAGLGYAQAPDMEWHRGYGTDKEEKPQHGMQTRDGGYIVVGMTGERARADRSDMLVVKTDAKGDEEWQRRIGSDKAHDWANFVEEVEDGYVIAGALTVSGDQERALVKLDSSGITVWQQTYPHAGVDALRGMDVTDDGSIVATGYAGGEEKGYLFISDSGKGSLMKTDPEGNLLWDRVLPSVMHGMRVEQVPKGYAIGGNKWSSAGMDVVLVLTDHEGNETYSNHYGGSGNDQCFDFVVASDGGYAMAGHSTSYGVNWDYYLLKIDRDGKEQWHRTFGQPRGYDPAYIHDESYGLQQTPDGGFVVAGGSGDEYEYSESGHPKGASDEWIVYIVKVDGDGKVQWEGLYGKVGAGHSAAEHINLTRDGGYVVFTDTDIHNSPPPNNFGIMKLAPDNAGK